VCMSSYVRKWQNAASAGLGVCFGLGFVLEGNCLVPRPRTLVPRPWFRGTVADPGGRMRGMQRTVPS